MGPTQTVTRHTGAHKLLISLWHFLLYALTTAKPESEQVKILPDASISGDSTANRSYLIRDFNVTLMVLSTIFVVSRVYVRKFVSNTFGFVTVASLVRI